MFARVLVLVAIVNRTLLAPLFAVMAGVVGAIAARTAGGRCGRPKRPRRQEPVQSDREAAKFGALFAVVPSAVKIVQENFLPGGLYAVAALAGLTDIDAITLSRRSSHGAATRTSPWWPSSSRRSRTRW